MTEQNMRRNRQAGGVSLFVVIFATLLITVVTLSFIQLMLKDQQQATANDLSQSAYDSAQAGVEDAKRALLMQQACEQGSGSPTCAALTAVMATQSCDMVQRALTATSTKETQVQQSGSLTDSALDQAYTCVKIDRLTDDYLYNDLRDGSSIVVPLAGTAPFNSVKVSWFRQANSSGAPARPTFGTSLPRVGQQWKANMPPLVRAQFMQTGSSFTLDDFDGSASGSNANTLFLFPSTVGGNPSFALDGRRSSSAEPYRVACVSSFTASDYLCSATITLPDAVGGAAGVHQNALLRLTSLYNTADYKIELYNGSTRVQFNGVQPKVDSTGRANDMFRRVETRLQMGGDVLYPSAAVDVEGDLCKNFAVTNQPSGYDNTTTCTP